MLFVIVLLLAVAIGHFQSAVEKSAAKRLFVSHGWWSERKNGNWVNLFVSPHNIGYIWHTAAKCDKEKLVLVADIHVHLVVCSVGWDFVHFTKVDVFQFKSRLLNIIKRTWFSHRKNAFVWSIHWLHRRLLTSQVRKLSHFSQLLSMERFQFWFDFPIWNFHKSHIFRDNFESLHFGSLELHKCRLHNRN